MSNFHLYNFLVKFFFFLLLGDCVFNGCMISWVTVAQQLRWKEELQELREPHGGVPLIGAQLDPKFTAQTHAL